MSDSPPDAGKRKWLLRGAGIAVALLAMAGTWAAFNAQLLRAKFAARDLTSATTDDERARYADAILACGEPGLGELVACLQSPDEPVRAAAVGAFDRHLESLPENDPRAINASGAILDSFPVANDGGRQAVLRLVPAILKRTGGAHEGRCRAVAAEALKQADFETRLAAARLATHPGIRLRHEVLPLLSAPEAQLRGAALFAAAASGDGEYAISDEELFRWLHDPDEAVRKICREALVMRDRSDAEIALGRRLTHPDPGERLGLLLDLRYDNDVADPEPWLERLSRDAEPAVRAGAARVAVEVAAARAQSCPAWVARVADADPHPTVRVVAAFYRAQPAGRRDPLRQIGGP